MKVLHLTNLYPTKVRGRGEFVRRWVEGLDAAGIQNHVYLLGGSGFWRYWTERSLFMQAVHDFKPDLVHVHHGLSAITFQPAAAVQPWVLSLWGSEVLGKPSTSWIQWWKAWVESRLVKKTMNHMVGKSVRRNHGKFCQILVRSSQMQSVLQQWGQDSMAMPSPIDTELFSPGDRERLRKEKGFPLELKICVFPWIPTRRDKGFILAQLVCNEAQKRWGKDQVKLVCLFDRSPKEIAQYYAMADLLLMPSVSEGSSNALKEAMASHCPAVSFQVGDNEYLSGGSDVYPVLPLGNGKQFVAKSLELLSHPPSENSFRRDFIVQNYSQPVVAQQAQRLYQRLLNSNENSN